MHNDIIDRLRLEVLKEITSPPRKLPFIEAFRDHFLEEFGDSVLAIIFYGSGLFEEDSPDLLYDFYIVVDFYEKVYNSPLYIILNKILPPSVYFAEVRQGSASKSCKYNIISFSDLTRYILEPPEIYIVGRFAKRSYIVYTKNDKIKEKLGNLVTSAQFFCLTYAIPFLSEMEKFGIEDIVKEALYISYRGEVRIEDPKKLDKLYYPFRDFYIKVFSKFFEYYMSENEGVVLEIEKGNNILDKRWAIVGSYIPSKDEVIKFLKTSARRGILRWPKGLITFKKYKEYLERKAIKSGENIKITELDKKLPLILGWRHVIKLISEGKLKPDISKEYNKK